MKWFYDPEIVALIGASANPFHPGHNLFENLRICFGDRFYPVNSRVEEIDGVRTYRRISDVPVVPDVAVIFIPAASVPAALAECGEKGIRRVIIESGGFAETGSRGQELHRQCLEIARRYGIRIWGPNCMGCINVPRGKVLSFLSPHMWKGRFLPGNVSLIVQSGMLSAGFLSQILSRTPFGLAKVSSIGNKMDVDEVEILEYLISDPDTEVIAMYLESISRGRRFFELARQTAKPVIVLKAGRTPLGVKAAASHTAALAQNEAVLAAALRQARIIRVEGMQELIEVARALGAQPVRDRKEIRTAVISFSGGAGVVTADALADWGMELARLQPETLARLKTVFPEWMDPDNPLDLYPGIEKHGPVKVLGTALEAVLADPEVDAVYAHFFVPPENIAPYDYDQLAALVRKHNKPFVVWTMGPLGNTGLTNAELEKRGIPVVDEIRKGVRLLAAITMRK